MLTIRADQLRRMAHHRDETRRTQLADQLTRDFHQRAQLLGIEGVTTAIDRCADCCRDAGYVRFEIVAMIARQLFESAWDTADERDSCVHDLVRSWEAQSLFVRLKALASQ